MSRIYLIKGHFLVSDLSKGNLPSILLQQTGDVSMQRRQKIPDLYSYHYIYIEIFDFSSGNKKLINLGTRTETRHLRLKFQKAQMGPTRVLGRSCGQRGERRGHRVWTWGCRSLTWLEQGRSAQDKQLPGTQSPGHGTAPSQRSGEPSRGWQEVPGWHSPAGTWTRCCRR